MKKIISSIILLAYFGISVFGVIHIVHMQKMDMQMSDCPFAQGEHSFCTMNVFEHLAYWKRMLDLTIPLALTVGIFFVAVFFHTLPNLPLPRKRRPVISLYQQLFSSGILNPKLH